MSGGRSWPWLLVIAAVAAGCERGDDDGGAGRDGGRSEEGADGGRDSGAGADELAVSLGPVPLEPSEERTFCVEKRLDNAEVAWIQTIRSTLRQGGHHMVLYRSDATEERTEPFDCFPFVETVCGQNVPLMISQLADETLQYPPGVGVRIEPRQMVRIEVHFLNATSDRLDVMEEIRIATLAESEVEREADFLLVGTPDIDIDPGQSAVAGPQFITLPDDFGDIEIFALTGHTHQYGTDVSVWRSHAAGDLTEKVYPDAAYDWHEPPVTFFDPPLSIPAGSGLTIQCTYDNTSADHVGVGESANEEMCFAWAYYTVARGYRVCLQSAHGGALVGGCCPGAEYCDEAAALLGCEGT